MRNLKIYSQKRFRNKKNKRFRRIRRTLIKSLGNPLTLMRFSRLLRLISIQYKLSLFLLLIEARHMISTQS